jgi:hypothetical protein
VGGPPAWVLGGGLPPPAIELKVCCETYTQPRTRTDSLAQAIRLAQDRDRWRAVANVVMKPSGSGETELVSYYDL